MYFSFARILGYKELQHLALLSTLEQIATFLSLDCDQPELDGTGGSYKSLKFYFIGAAAGLLVLALSSIFLRAKQPMLFLPIFTLNCLQLAFFSFCLV